jgi:hypothetical protein
VVRRPTSFTNLSKKKTFTRKVGDVTKEFIENSKTDLKDHIKELETKR